MLSCHCTIIINHHPDEVGVVGSKSQVSRVVSTGKYGWCRSCRHADMYHTCVDASIQIRVVLNTDLRRTDVASQLASRT